MQNQYTFAKYCWLALNPDGTLLCSTCTLTNNQRLYICVVLKFFGYLKRVDAWCRLSAQVTDALISLYMQYMLHLTSTCDFVGILVVLHNVSSNCMFFSNIGCLLIKFLCTLDMFVLWIELVPILFDVMFNYDRKKSFIITLQFVKCLDLFDACRTNLVEYVHEFVNCCWNVICSLLLCSFLFQSMEFSC